MRPRESAVGLLAFCWITSAAARATSGEAHESPSTHPAWGFTFGGGAIVGTPSGEFREHVDIGGGLAGHAILSAPGRAFGLRADASWLLYGSETLRAPLSETAGRVLVDVARTDNWIGQLSIGPQIALPRGRVRPYAHAFAGVAYISTTSEPVAPPPLATLPLFIETTHLDDATFSYGGGAGVQIALGSGRTALELGACYTRNGPVSFLVEGDLTGDGSVFTSRRSRADMIEFRVGVTTLR